ncbi:MAG TPA: MBL fold metallo-hydrolase [Thermoplasmata archaeon]|nr:MBL fold metallo-hydrolase [Thermoplasmata archaeon]
MPLPSIHRIEVPTGLPVGAVNAYILPRAPATLVDTGPAVDGAWEALQQGMASAGLALADLEQIAITHGHVDHFGLAAAVRKESGARVLAPAGDADMVVDFHATYARRAQRYGEVLRETGTPDTLREGLAGFFAHLDTLGDGVPVDVLLQDGDTFEGGGELLTAVHTPGHSRGSTCLLAASGPLFTGDTVILGITPISAFGGRDGLSVGLADYLTSLDRLSVLPARLALPGHRDPVRDIRGYARDIRRHHGARQIQVLSLLAEERTAWEVSRLLFGDLPVTEVFLGIVEALAHLEVLEASGRVSSRERDGLRRYVRAA